MQVFQEITETLSRWHQKQARKIEKAVENQTLLLGEAIQLACLIEATSRKAGNVHPWASFDDLSYVDFCHAGESLAKFGSQLALNPQPSQETPGSLGTWIEQAVAASHSSSTSNVNLGIVLLIAPLAMTWRTGMTPRTDTTLTNWQEAVARLIATSTTADAAAMYRAIMAAKPGGLGKSATQDVRETPTVTLQEAMHLARDRDQIAACYDDGFASLFQHWLPRLSQWIDELSKANAESCCLTSSWEFPPAAWEVATIGLQLELLAHHGDSLIARKLGPEFHSEVSLQAQKILEADWPYTATGWQLYHTFDQWLRADGHQRNPGTTADIIAATWFVYLRMVLSP
ncbi:triphosphoribosyl-dephospho-CoA protein [Planctopirus limnophila DSM 3776]|uniref:Triphosphoribosyl-dephospho-CoA protein n=1 Tax=Planctopirus limnophila (strain ATCC 43296 / DSM 3776 / IFAM 1008 / Mu 290) TaxID=521674 RepID=D5SP89_PLAL2|nr:triphosphoribosyl-dephospho-CoA synthase [Planctopirus limnophila]ADG68233.1 triphosphoribosyl-dephospho-CoA protein [Planctopirus limnophila DSM 3776]